MANTQTAVPLFVANAILTAAQQNISAGTGVPVFATTVTRDAAFGGSNKALAEGQLAYIEASNIVQYYDGAAWATVGPASASGLVCVKAETAFSAVSSFNSGTVFSSTYSNYVVKLRYTTTGSDVFIQMSSGGTPATGANYNFQSVGGYGNTISVIEGADNQTSGRVTGNSVGTFYSDANIDLFSPFVAEPTTINTFGGMSEGAYTSAVVKLAFTNHSLSTSYDGFTLLVSTGTMTGNYAVYGYSKAV